MNAKPPTEMSRNELIALIAMLFSTIAFSVDSLLPAFPDIENDLNIDGQAHLLITFFMAGLAVGTLFAGPISDAIGRKLTMCIGAAIYIAAGGVAFVSHDFEVILAARLVQGAAAAAPRVVSLAVVRDLYSGRHMAQIVSFAMVLFTLVPTLAPAMGAVLQEFFGWRAILLAFIVFSTISTLWLWLRLPESLPRDSRRPFRLTTLWVATKEVLAHPVVRLSIAAQSVALSLIFCLLVQVQPIYAETFGRAESFPYWFGAVALISAASTSLANAVLVMRVGMRRLVTWGMAGHVIFAALTYLVISTLPNLAFPAFLVWQFVIIWMTGITYGNLSAIALQPMGHIAGFTASVTGAISTMAAATLASFVGSIFDGTPLPLLMCSCVIASIGLIFMWQMNRLDELPSDI